MSKKLTVDVNIKTKSGKYLVLSIPAIKIVCPHCLGTCNNNDNCVSCNGLNVVDTIDDNFLAKHPKIAKAIDRYDFESQKDAWEAYGERIWGC